MIIVGYIIDLAVGIIAGVLATVITNLMIQRRIDKKDKKRQDLLELYCFYLQLRQNLEIFEITEIEKVLVKSRLIFENDKIVYSAFNKVDIGLSHTLRLLKSGGEVNYNFNCDEYHNFLFLLKKEIGGIYL